MKDSACRINEPGETFTAELTLKRCVICDKEFRYFSEFGITAHAGACTGPVSGIGRGPIKVEAMDSSGAGNQFGGYEQVRPSQLHGLEMK